MLTCSVVCPPGEGKHPVLSSVSGSTEVTILGKAAQSRAAEPDPGDRGASDVCRQEGHCRWWAGILFSKDSGKGALLCVELQCEDWEAGAGRGTARAQHLFKEGSGLTADSAEDEGILKCPWTLKFSGKLIKTISVHQCRSNLRDRILGKMKSKALLLCQEKEDTAGPCPKKLCVPTWEIWWGFIALP